MSFWEIYGPAIILVGVCVGVCVLSLLLGGRFANWLGFGNVGLLRILVTAWVVISAAFVCTNVFLKTVPDSWFKAGADPVIGSIEIGIGLDHSAIFSETKIIDPGPVSIDSFETIKKHGGVWFVQPAIFDYAMRQIGRKRGHTDVLMQPGLTIYRIHEHDETKERVSTYKAIKLAVNHEKFVRQGGILLVAHPLQAARGAAMIKKALRDPRADVVILPGITRFEPMASSWQNRSREVYILWEMIARIKAKFSGEL